MEKETLRELAKMLREQYVNNNDLLEFLKRDAFDRGKVGGAIEVIEAIERLVDSDDLLY